MRSRRKRRKSCEHMLPLDQSPARPWSPTGDQRQQLTKSNLIMLLEPNHSKVEHFQQQQPIGAINGETTTSILGNHLENQIRNFKRRTKLLHFPATLFVVTKKANLLFYLILLTLSLLSSPQPVQLVLGQRSGSANRYQQPSFIQSIASSTNTRASNQLNLPELITQQGGIVANRNLTLSKQFNPILITRDIVIRKDAKLTIEPGAELLFDKRKGIIVYGTLEILGQPNDRVKLNLLRSRQSATVNFRSQNNNPIRQQQVRLVDGDWPNEGRVQIKFNNRWHSLCTDSKNLTLADINVICRQVGYQDGYWYRWFPKRNESIHQIMSKSFMCNGHETSVSQCRRWNRVRTGGGICDYHSDIGIRCSKRLVTDEAGSDLYDYWRGLEFINSETVKEYVLGGQMEQRVSKSSLRHLIISDAGTNEAGNATAAISVIGQPPKMNHLEIKNSIYGIMIEDVDDALNMSNIYLHDNMAMPLFINTSWGKVSFDNLRVENNGGDGIRVARHEKFLVGTHDFCQSRNFGSSRPFPAILSHEQSFFTAERDCCQEFSSNNELTVHFPVMRSTPNNLLPEGGDSNKRVSIPPGLSIGKDAHLLIYDDYLEAYPFRLRIQNGTRAQSVVSKSGRLKICYEPALYRTVLFTIEVVADYYDEWTGIARDVEISNSYIRGNEGRGVWVENQRSGIKIINTTISNHNYLAGLHVENGTGEVIIQASYIGNNSGHGVYINQAGGYYHIDNSTISHNLRRGIYIDHDQRPSLVSFNHTFHLGYSLVMSNGENGIFLGNVCRSDAFWNISMNSFIKNGEDAIYYQSCLPTQDAIYTFKYQNLRLNISDFDSSNPSYYHQSLQELHITHNTFLANERRAIHMAPVFFVKSLIRHNLFREHPLAVIHISNQIMMQSSYYLSMLENSTQAPVNIRIASNRFFSNLGRYVASLGVLEDNFRHSLVFTKNILLDNAISEPYSELKPRSRVSAVVVVSSSNTKVIRNSFDNPQSAFEFGSHLEMHSKIINATANFWGSNLDAASIYRRIFDRKDRYNLAQVEFLQYLLSSEDLEFASDLSFERKRDKITTFKNGTRLGGEIKGFEELPTNTYSVVSDLFVRSGAHLVLKEGTVLKFNDGVGMMVQGRLDAVGKPDSHILFTSAIASNRIPTRAQTSTTPAPLSNPWVSHQPDVSGDDGEYVLAYSKNNNNRIKKRQVSSGSQQTARLSHTTMGRLEVLIDGIFGSVCDYNFDVDDAAVVCQQLGMILNKDDWLLERYQYAANDQQQISMMSSSVLMTNVRCDPSLDTDITKCKAELSSRGDFDGMCNSEVGIRCFPPSWSGLRLGMGAEKSILEYVTIQRAGMFDYAAYTLKPALQVDFNRHLITSVNVRYSSDSGLGIMWNDVIGRHHSELVLSDSKFNNNERHGVHLKSKGLTIRDCSLSGNRQNGLDYDPSFSKADLNELLSWLYTAKNFENIVTLTFPLTASSRYYTVPSSEDAYRFFVLRKNPQANLPMENFTIETDPRHTLSIQLLSPIQIDSTEQLSLSTGLGPEWPIWNFKVNTTSFPMVSSGSKFYFNYTTGAKPRGNIILYIRSRFSNRDHRSLHKYIPAYLVMNKFENTANNINSKLLNSLVISNSNFTRNGIGLKFKHPNYSYGHEEGSFNLRYCNETTNITGNTFDSNYITSIFVGSDDFEPEPEFDSNNNNNRWLQTIPASEIHYNLIGNKLRRNKDGIRQFSRLVRYTNNVFHWSINDTSFEFNKGGGINIVLPYFWHYDANLSHTIDLNSNNFSKNTNFELSLDGHYALVNLTRNVFRENRCKSRLISLNGMEKQMKILQNFIEYNTCDRLIDFNIQSHADKMGHVTAQFEFNSLRHNKKSSTNATYLSMSKHSKWLAKLNPLGADYMLCLRSIQAVNISRNLFVNPELRFELVVAIVMDLEERSVNAIENYWGSAAQSEIDKRIFDFDDWNSFAVAETSPYLVLESFVSSTIIGEPKTMLAHYTPYPKSADKFALGGRMTKSTTLVSRKEPYLIESDLTVMPNVTLIIEKGAVLEFMPNIGILVLGTLIAAGTRDKPIQMRPSLNGHDVAPFQQHLFPLKTKPNLQTASVDTLEHNYYAHRRYQFAYPIDMGSIRLCKNEICNDGSHIYENNVEDQTLRQEVLRSSNSTWKIDGFLEIFNMTTLQWVPVCDPLFTERSAQVVCRQLGYTHFSLFRRGRRYTIEQERIMSIRDWPETVQCEGDESGLASCVQVAQGFTNHSAACVRDSSQFVYVYCRDFPEISNANNNGLHGNSNEHIHHWAGLRFSCPLAQTMMNDDTYGIGAALPGYARRSRLQYVSIERAGMLHRKRSPAVQALQCNVQMEYVAITGSAHHGLEIISSNGNQNFHQLRLRNNLGVGLNYVSLTGSSSANRLVPYLPLKHLDISSDIFGLVDICGANKEIQIGERLLLFYRYTSQPVDCVKIISSKLSIKHIGFRMLQFDLFNSTPYTLHPDSVKLYDGNIFDRDSRLLVDLGTTEKHRLEKPELKFYQSNDHTMTIRLHASGASHLFGFIAEVVTTPASYNIPRDSYNNLTYSELVGNKLGAMTVASAGESSPNLILKNNRFESNCLHLFGNFTSCPSSIYMELQNCQRLRILDNLIKNNQGGLTIKSYSHSAVSALDGIIGSNVFEANMNTNTLALLGPKTDPYQTVRVTQNFFTRNVAQYLSNIILSRIVANFSYNIISGNTGKHQIEVIGFDKLPLSYQTFSHNWIYNNTATLERDRSTISGNSAGQQYFYNYLVNPPNHFEISTMNWSRYDVKPFHTPKDDEMIHLISGDGSSRHVFRKTADAIPVNIVDTKKSDLYHATINAKHNWWGFEMMPAIRSRIKDRKQHEELIEVDFNPYLESNKSVLSGICAGGWQRVGGACLVYVGSRMTYQESKEFCDRELATLPLLRGNHYEISDYVRQQDMDYDTRIDRIWVRSFDVPREACPALNDFRTKNYDCQDKYGFICEKDPQVVVSFGLYWYRETGGLIALILATITTMLTCCCLICWAYKSRWRRKEKIERKNSIYASMRSQRYSNSSNTLSELFLHRQLYNHPNTDKTSLTNLSLSTQITQPSESSHLVRLDPSFSGSQQQQKARTKINESSYYNSPRQSSSAQPIVSPQPAENSAYANSSPAQSINRQQQDHSLVQPKPDAVPKTPTPVPSYREVHPRALGGSRTPSYSGSTQMDDTIFPEPMPVLNGAPIAYSQINHAINSGNNLTNNNNNNKDKREFYRKLSPAESDPVYANGLIGHQPMVPLMASSDLSGSTVPTYYSDSQQLQQPDYMDRTQSYIEAFNEAYNKTIQGMNSVYELTTKTTTTTTTASTLNHSSYTDLLIKPSQVTATVVAPMNQLISMAPQGPQEYPQLDLRPIYHYHDDLELNGCQQNRAYLHSDYPPGLGNQRGAHAGSSGYLVETSLDFEPARDNPNLVAAPTSTSISRAPTASMFGSSQRLSPVSSSGASFGPLDSKQGSRVYLETSFE